MNEINRPEHRTDNPEISLRTPQQEREFDAKLDRFMEALDASNIWKTVENNNRFYSRLSESYLYAHDINSVEGMNKADVRRINGETADVGTVNTWLAFKADVRNQEKYANLNEAKEAYIRLVNEQSPWIDGVKPELVELPEGTRFEMAMSKDQPDYRPGAFGTLDHIEDSEFVRNNLAVKEDWKPDIDRINTYEVIRSLPVNYGEVGPQVDVPADRYLYGGANQIEMKVHAHERMKYITLVESRKVE